MSCTSQKAQNKQLIDENMQVFFSVFNALIGNTVHGYEKPLPLDAKTGKLRRAFTEKERIGLGKRNRKFRKYLTNKRRHMDRELLFGYAATRMMNKVGHLYVPQTQFIPIFIN